ncbi:hypothetical protein BX600DRAFT_1013 [Xylariales sp. PMI_506]|nr:hypothetical protein BX600DRAFT_1013 [Xylariales sp. PMI_506]
MTYPELPSDATSSPDMTLSMAIFCIRYMCLPEFAAERKNETCMEGQRLSFRKTTRPFYRYAALSWMRLSRGHWDNEDMQRTVMQLFDTSYTLQLRQWLLECAHNWFPRNVGLDALSRKPFMELILILDDTSIDIRLHAAAMMSLPWICRRLIESGSDPNERSPLGMPLHCAFAGKASLVILWMHILKEYSHLHLNDMGNVEQYETIKILLDSGADCYAKSPSQGDPMSPRTMALLICSSLRAPELFFRVIGDDADFDPQFTYAFERGIFLEILSFTNPTSEEARTYLNTLFEGMAYRILSSVDIMKAQTTSRVYELIWHFTLTDKLDWHERIEQQAISSVSDEDFAGFVDTAGLSSVNMMRLVSKDPRFDPNQLDKNRAPLLHRANLLGVEMIKLFAEKGADLSLSDPEGTTLAHLSAQAENKESLRYLAEKGVDMTLISMSQKDKEGKPTGANVSADIHWLFVSL